MTCNSTKCLAVPHFCTNTQSYLYKQLSPKHWKNECSLTGTSVFLLSFCLSLTSEVIFVWHVARERTQKHDTCQAVHHACPWSMSLWTLSRLPAQIPQLLDPPPTIQISCLSAMWLYVASISQNTDTICNRFITHFGSNKFLGV